MCLQAVGWGLDWIDLLQNMYRRWALLSAVMKTLVL